MTFTGIDMAKGKDAAIVANGEKAVSLERGKEIEVDARPNDRGGWSIVIYSLLGEEYPFGNYATSGDAIAVCEMNGYVVKNLDKLEQAQRVGLQGGAR